MSAAAPTNGTGPTAGAAGSAPTGGELPVPAEVQAVLEGQPAVGELDQAFPFLTVDAAGTVDVCLLSRTELAVADGALRAVLAGTRVRRNLVATGRATLLAVADNAAHTLALQLRRSLEGEGAMAAELAVVRATRDDAGVELFPFRFRVADHLKVAERWDRTAALLGRLAAEEGPS